MVIRVEPILLRELHYSNIFIIENDFSASNSSFYKCRFLHERLFTPICVFLFRCEGQIPHHVTQIGKAFYPRSIVCFPNQCLYLLCLYAFYVFKLPPPTERTYFQVITPPPPKHLLLLFISVISKLAEFDKYPRALKTIKYLH